MTDQFVHLHLHTDYSALDGAGRVKDYVQRAASQGMSALTMSDHGNLFGAYDFYAQCVAADIKPIIGIEFYVAPDSLDRKEPVFWGTSDQRPDDVGSGGAATHLTVLAVSAEGLRNLYRLHHLSYTRGFYYKPRIDVESLARFSGGLVTLTGCAGSALNTRFRLGQDYEAQAYLGELCDAVGKENVFVEVMDHNTDFDVRINRNLMRLSRSHNLPLVATNDCHYVREEDALSHDALLCLQTRARLADDSRFRFEGRGYHLKTRREMEKLRLPSSAYDNTLAVAERVGSYSEVLSEQDLSRMAIAPGVEDADTELWMLCMGWLMEKPRPDEYERQMIHELNVIAAMGFSHYFLVLRIICAWARANGVRIGPGRGSAGGSLVAFSLGITQIDPIRHGLLFERFLNPDRVGFPDIDVDVDDLKRPALLAFIRETFGVDNVAQIITLNKIGARRALLDSAFVSGMPTKVGRDLTARLPKAQFGRQPALSDGDWSDLDETEKDALELAEQIEGLIRQPGIHAAGLVISSRSLVDSQPVWQPKGVEGLVTGFDMNAQEPLGLVKMDFLGLRNLSVIDETLLLLSLRNGEPVSLPADADEFTDQKTYDLLASGNTLGVFQLDSPGMRGLLRKLRPSTFDDVSAVLALYRPGPMGADSHNSYAKRKNAGEGSWRSEWAIHSDLEKATRPLLEETYGLLIYQEQVMRILGEIGGYSMTEASTMLKVFKFKDRERLAKEHDRFLEGGSARGFSRDSLERIWSVIVPFADYAFNKAHSVGYGYISYWTAFLKANYPVEYMAALLGSTADDPDRLSEYFTECYRLGIRLLPPDINESGLGFTPVGVGGKRGIRYGLTGIRGLGEKVCNAIISKRPYSSAADFFRRVDKRALNAKVLDCLAKSGALDGLGQREGWIAQGPAYAERAMDERAKAKTGQRGILKSRYTIGKHPVLYAARKDFEQEVLGISLTPVPVGLESPRPLDLWELEYIKRVTEQYPGDQPLSITIGGILLQDIASLRLTDKSARALAALGGIEVIEVE